MPILPGLILPFTLVLAVQPPPPPQAPSAVGTSGSWAGKWEGVVQYRGRDTHVVITLKALEGGRLSATLTQEGGSTDVPMEVALPGDRLLRLTSSEGMVYEGRLGEDGNQLRGTATYLEAPDMVMSFLVKRAVGGGTAPVPFVFQDHYRKREVRIPMRDGVELYTAIYEPRDLPGPHPVLLTRSPYSSAPYGPDAFAYLYGSPEAFARKGYILAYQDVRGRFQSGGTFQHVRPMLTEPHPAKAVDESTDTYDTVDWLVKHVEGNNGRVGLYGLSYPGFYAAAGLVRSHPALKAVSPQAPIMDWFIGDDMHRNGALCLDMVEFFAGFFGPETNRPTTAYGPELETGTPDGYRFYLSAGPVRNLPALDKRGQSPFLKEALAHPTYDAFWQARNLRPHLRDVTPAVLTVGGWYDGEDMFGALECFKTVGRQSPHTENHLVMGPWSHGQWVGSRGEALGQGDWGQDTAAQYRDQVEKPFFDHHLLGAAAPALPKAFLFEGGTHRWRSFDAWPPPQARARAFHLGGGGRLESAPAAPGFDEWVSDPARPVPYHTGVTTYHTGTYLVEDQRLAATRPDVAVYETEPLTEDLTVGGPVKADLVVSTTGTDSDWVVKVIDVHPGDEPDPLPNPRGYHNGHYQELVRADVMRGKFRNSFERPEPFVPGQPTRVAWTLNDVLHTFRKGHRIMVQVQCSWFPLVDRNPQTFININEAGPEAFVKATQRLYRGPEQDSRVELPVLAP